jgi:DNA-binding transcriptional LysR family regulator
MSRITIAQIEAFFWTTELGSVQRAAAKLHLAQPTVSLRLRQLEAEVAAPLLEKLGRKLSLTREGHAFLSYARLVLDAYWQMQNASARTVMSGTLRIGLAEGFAVACLPPLIAALDTEFPLLRPEWMVSTSSGLEQDLARGDLDVAVLVDAVGHPSIRLIPLGVQRTLWAESGQLGIKPGATPRDLCRFRLVTTPPPTAMYRAMIGWFALAQQPPGPLCICTSLSVAARLVGAGIGIGAFPLRMIEAYRSAGGMSPIASDPPLDDGRVYVADRITADQARTATMIRVLEDVTRSIGYFEKN